VSREFNICLFEGSWKTCSDNFSCVGMCDSSGGAASYLKHGLVSILVINCTSKL